MGGYELGGRTRDGPRRRRKSGFYAALADGNDRDYDVSELAVTPEDIAAGNFETLTALKQKLDD